MLSSAQYPLCIIEDVLAWVLKWVNTKKQKLYFFLLQTKEKNGICTSKSFGVFQKKNNKANIFL